MSWFAKVNHIDTRESVSKAQYDSGKEDLEKCVEDIEDILNINR